MAEVEEDNVLVRRERWVESVVRGETSVAGIATDSSSSSALDFSHCLIQNKHDS